MKSTYVNQSIPRPPVVVVMGHVDHGKSTLLDYIRQTNVTAEEAGGITQTVSAYEVSRHRADNHERKITFIDTPGHAAFIGMRARGASMADLAILVVSAEEGVKTQTLEAARAIKEQKLPTVIALNKIDRPGANVERVKQQLAEHNLAVEGYGGQIPVAAISAKTGEGVDDLLDLVELVAELEHLTGNPAALASGFIMEAHRDPRAGITAELIIKNGTLTVGQYLVAERVISKIRRLNDYRGGGVSSLTFSAPATVSGFGQSPPIGVPFQSFNDKTAAEAYLDTLPAPHTPVAVNQAVSIDSSADIQTIPLVIKADRAGGAEAVEQAVRQITTPDKVRLKIISAGSGAVNESDVKTLGKTRPAVILAFNIGSDRVASDLAEKAGVTIASFDIIYKLTEWLEIKLAEWKPRQIVEERLGQAKLLKIFNQSGARQIIGGTVVEGKLIAGADCRISRRGNELGRGHIVGLEQNRQTAREVTAGQQFGAAVETKITLAAGDVLEPFELVNK